MRLTAEAFLDQQLPQAGIVAAAVRNADGSVVVRCVGNTMTPGQVEAAVIKLWQAADVLRRHQLEVTHVRWTFEQARVHLARRSDGAVLVLFVDRENDRARQVTVKDLLMAFGDEG